MSELNQEELIGILRRAGKLPGLRGWHGGTVEQIVALIQKPKVDEEFVWKMVEESVYILHKDKHLFFKRKLKEAGVEVKK